MANQVKLLRTWRSPYSRRVEIALKLKGVDYEFADEDLTNKSDLLLQSNPVHKKIPVLLHDGKPICESLVILEYIDETWSGFDILPRDPCERAQARFWARFIDEKCIPGIWQVIKSKGEDRKKAKAEVDGHLNILEKELHGKKFFAGEQVGLVDLAGSFLAHWVMIFQDAIEFPILTAEQFPALCQWADDFVGADIVKEALPDKDIIFSAAKAHFG